MRRIEAIDSTLNGLPQNIIRDMAYRGDNQITECTLGNGLKDTREYDLQGRLTRQVLKDEFDITIDERTYAYDKNSNILNIDTDFEDNAYSYDKLDRVVSDTSLGNPEVDATPIAFSYDLNDNRLSKAKTDLSEEGGYQYLTASNRLLAKETFAPAGPSPIQERDRQLIYNDAGRLYQLFENGTLKAEYVYNDEGQRTRKVVFAPDGFTIASITIFHYDYMGYLITETEETGQLIRDYIWTESMHPVAQIDHQAGTEVISYLYTDHLMTNRLATDEFGQVIWRWEGEAFGNTPAEELAGISINLRFPGQYFDAETNLHYNWHRYYDPEVGRYITSDPLGLSAGNNTYLYALSNSIRFADSMGLQSYQCIRPLGSDPGENRRTGPDIWGNPAWHRYSCFRDPSAKSGYRCGGSGPSGNPLWSPGIQPDKDKFHPEACEQTEVQNECFEDCLLDEWVKPRPTYGWPGLGTDCKEYDDNVNVRCRRKCGLN